MSKVANIIAQKGVYIGANGRPSPYDWISGPEPSSRLVVFAHGYKGFKDWGPWHLLAPFFVERGYDWLAFNFSHNGGTVQNPIDFPDLDAFAANTYSKEVLDLNLLLDKVFSGEISSLAKHRWKEVYLIGHSRGGGIVTLVAGQLQERIAGIATWAAVADFGERFPADVSTWKKEGVMYVANARTGQQLPHLFSYWEDYHENREKLHILNAAKRFSRPVLVTHGSEDEAVDFSNAERLYASFPQSSILKVEGARHTFGGKHPWDSEALPPQLRHIAEESVKYWNANRSG